MGLEMGIKWGKIEEILKEDCILTFAAVAVLPMLGLRAILVLTYLLGLLDNVTFRIAAVHHVLGRKFNLHTGVLHVISPQKIIGPTYAQSSLSGASSTDSRLDMPMSPSAHWLS